MRTRADGNSAPTNHFPNGTQMGLFAFYIPSDGNLMKKIYLAAMAVAALTVSSCSQDEVLNINPEAGAKAIEFGVYTGKTAQTRGTETTTATVAEDGFGVSAVWTQGTATGTTWTSAVPNFNVSSI